MTTRIGFISSLLSLLLWQSPTFGQGKATLARETAEYVLRRFGKAAAEKGTETLSRRIESLAAKSGDDAFLATRKIGPQIFRIVEEVGEHGTESVKLMAKYGEDAIWVVAKPKRMAIFLKYGDHAAESMIKHREIAEPLLESFGKPAARALSTVSPRSGRRLAMMAADGELSKVGRSSEFLEIVAIHGDRAMDFIWKNKGALTVAAALTAFLANPEPFLDGTSDIAKYTTEHIVKPIASIPVVVASEAAKGVNWNTLALCGTLTAGALSGMKSWLNHRSNMSKSRHTDMTHNTEQGTETREAG